MTPDEGFPAQDVKALADIAADPVMVSVASVMADYVSGDGQNLIDEFVWLDTHHASKVNCLLNSVVRKGIHHPIMLGPDGRVWDGHHRLCVAWMLGLREVPAVLVTDRLAEASESTT